MIGLGGRDEARSHERAYPGVAMWVATMESDKTWSPEETGPIRADPEFYVGNSLPTISRVDKFHSV